MGYNMLLEFGPQFDIISSHVWDKRVFELEEHSFLCNIPIMIFFHNRIAGMRKLSNYCSTSGELNLLFKDGCCRADRMHNARETIIPHHPHPGKWPIWDILDDEFHWRHHVTHVMGNCFVVEGHSVKVRVWMPFFIGMWIKCEKVYREKRKSHYCD